GERIDRVDPELLERNTTCGSKRRLRDLSDLDLVGNLGRFFWVRQDRIRRVPLQREGCLTLLQRRHCLWVTKGGNIRRHHAVLETLAVAPVESLNGNVRVERRVPVGVEELAARRPEEV